MNIDCTCNPCRLHDYERFGEQEREKGAIAERARIVAWLRDEAYDYTNEVAQRLAKAIEDGEHVKEGEPAQHGEVIRYSSCCDPPTTCKCGHIRTCPGMRRESMPGKPMQTEREYHLEHGLEFACGEHYRPTPGCPFCVVNP